jgi:hypothetical protein
MIFRALFWIAVVAILMPREPDLGLGRPGAAHAPTNADARFTCEGYGKSCVTALDTLDSFQSIAVRSLAQVKAEIEADKRTHGAD